MNYSKGQRVAFYTLQAGDLAYRGTGIVERIKGQVLFVRHHAFDVEVIEPFHKKACRPIRTSKGR